MDWLEIYAVVCIALSFLLCWRERRRQIENDREYAAHPSSRGMLIFSVIVLAVVLMVAIPILPGVALICLAVKICRGRKSDGDKDFDSAMNRWRRC